MSSPNSKTISLPSFFDAPLPQDSNGGSGGNSQSDQQGRREMMLLELLKFGIAVGLSSYFGWSALKMLSAVLGQDNSPHKASEQTKKALAKRLNRPAVETMDFNTYEERFLSDIVGPNELGVSFKDIGGMQEELEEVNDNVILPIQLWNRFKNIDKFSSCPTGVLLYGAPGTGKSLTAKAIAHEASATFINVKASSLMDKFLGESDKLVSALFSLGRKLAPTIIFIDEIETVLRKRSSSPFTSSGISSMQGVFLAEWDGLTVDRNDNVITDGPDTTQQVVKSDQQQLCKKDVESASGPVVVLGATNRPMDLDNAFLRRMPVKIQTRVPTEAARLEIFRAQLIGDALSDDVKLEELAARTNNFTGSDIREVIRVAKQQRDKMYILSARESLEMVTDNKVEQNAATAIMPPKIPLEQGNFLKALQKTVTSCDETKQFGKDIRLNEFQEAVMGKLGQDC